MVETRSRPWRPPQRVVAAAIALFLAGFVFSHTIRISFFLFFLAFLLAVVLDYPVRALTVVVRRRSVAAVIMLLAILGGVAWGVSAAVPALVKQGSNVVEAAPEALEKVETWWNRVRGQAPVEGVPSGQQIEKSVRRSFTAEAGEVLQTAIPVASTTLTVLASLLLILVLATFMVASPSSYAEGIVRLVPPSQEQVTRDFLVRLVTTTRGWMVAQIISMAFVGTLTAVGLLIIGVESWLVLGLVNFFCEFVPYIGPFLGAVPGVAVGFASSTRTGIYTLGLYFLIQQLEGNLIHPLAMRHEVRLPPPLLLVWQVVMGTAFGLLGVIVATPLLACIKVAVEFFWVERALGKPPAPEAAR